MVHNECNDEQTAIITEDTKINVDANAIILKELVGKENSIAIVTLNRPKSFNALSNDLIDELIKTLKEYDNDDGVKVIIITGCGRAFCAGADIKEIKEREMIELMKSKFPSKWNEITKIAKPLIAAVNGIAFGGGFELALMCDIIYASDKASFSLPEVNIATMPGAGGTQRLTRLAGKSNAMELCLTGNRLSAEDAKQCGIISKVYSNDALIKETIKLAERISQQSSFIVSLIKQSINNAYETTLQQGILFERSLFHSTFASEDIKEGMNAFIEKRSPQWHNK